MKYARVSSCQKHQQKVICFNFDDKKDTTILLWVTTAMCRIMCMCVFFFLAFSLYLSSRWFLSHIFLVTISIVWLFYGIAPTVAGVLYTTVSLYSLIGGPKAWICQQTTRCICVWVFVYFTLLFLIFRFFLFFFCTQ